MGGDRIDAVLSALEASRADLLLSLGLLAPTDFARPEIADQLWQVGVADDWTRLVIDQSLAGRPLAERVQRARPTYLVTSDLLVAWLDQTRGALVARLRRFGDDDLDRTVDFAGGTRSTYAALLNEASERDLACSEALRRRA